MIADDALDTTVMVDHPHLKILMSLRLILKRLLHKLIRNGGLAAANANPDVCQFVLVGQLERTIYLLWYQHCSLGCRRPARIEYNVIGVAG
jgi:hypothetical protein